MIRLGTRGSVLARWQSDWAAGQLAELGINVEIIVIQTSGDLVQHESIINIGAQGVFTKEIQRALLENQIDVAVHSLKDLPTDPVPGLSLAAVPKRGSHRDAFLSLHSATIDGLPPDSRIGTGSLRRKTQILHCFGEKYRVDDIRGNVETRLRKLEQGEYDAVILAEAGLMRLGFADRIRSFLEPPFFFPAIGQGALGLEIRSDDQETAMTLAPLSDEATFAAVKAERAMLRTLQGGCSAPIAALGEVQNAVLSLQGRVLSLDGKEMYETTLSTPFSTPLSSDPEELGVRVAEELLKKISGGTDAAFTG
ncbi:porphobilinogen deaminase [Planctomycetales bacterium]|nr:porphobilinogen deaminase [Planctomycetales bacterium]